jgi:hypothetical protein
MGSQWYDGARYKLVAREFTGLAKKVAELGMEGVSIWGEVSSNEVANEINYLSVSYFADHPHESWDGFVSDALAPRLGGEDLAFAFIELLEKGEVGNKDLELAKYTLRDLDDPAYRRWVWMIAWLYQRLDNPDWRPKQGFGMGEKLKGVQYD